eukprot:2458_1
MATTLTSDELVSTFTFVVCKIFSDEGVGNALREYVLIQQFYNIHQILEDLQTSDNLSRYIAPRVKYSWKSTDQLILYGILLKMSEKTSQMQEILIDFSIFDRLDYEIHVCKADKYNSFNRNWCNGDKEKIEDCTRIKRITTALAYYTSLDILNNLYHLDEFTHFFCEIYGEFANDYLCVVDEHSHQFEEIYESLIISKRFVECDVSKCAFTTRHYKCNESVLDPTLAFYQRMLDSLHV